MDADTVDLETNLLAEMRRVRALGLSQPVGSQVRVECEEEVRRSIDVFLAADPRRMRDRLYFLSRVKLFLEVKLSPGEAALITSIIEHIYPDPQVGSVLPVDRGELRAAKGIARKGLVTLNEEDGRTSMTFTELGAQMYRQLQISHVGIEASRVLQTRDPS
ncbi:hypothetical protein ACXIVK_27940 [Paraburkholderia caledonica]|jgi:hypothetical protein